MKELFKEVIRINQIDNTLESEKQAFELLERLNTLKMPEYFNWASDVFEELHVSTQPEKTALQWMDLDTGEARTYSYKALSENANQLVNFFEKFKLSRGSHFYMMSSLVPENWFATLACIKAGVTCIPTAGSMTRRELEYRFETCPPDAIMADEASADLIDQALEQTHVTPKFKLVMGQADGWESYEQVLQESKEAEAAQTRSEDTLFCFFTSGTTGLPKRVGHTCVSYPVGHISSTLMIGLRPDDIHNSVGASGWAKWSWSSFFAPLNVGATIAGFKYAQVDPEQYLKALVKTKVTTFCAHPTVWRRIANAIPEKIDLPLLRDCLSAGEPLSPDAHNKWEAGTGLLIRDFYGQTETTAMIGNFPWMTKNMKVGAMGKPSPMYDLALVDNEGNEITEPDQVGHIVVKLDKWRALGLFSEYIGSPDKMSSVFVDNYYYTSDRGTFDEDGFWWFVGRADDVIKSSDYRIGPFEVESALSEHEAVAEVAVIGSPDPNRSQLVKAYVILNSNFTESKDLALALFRHAITILPKFKIPRIIEFVEEVPKTISGKIRRVDLRQLESDRYGGEDEDRTTEYFYWDFPEFSSRKKE